jgi:hypothetical protein
MTNSGSGFGVSNGETLHLSIDIYVRYAVSIKSYTKKRI